MAVTVTHPFVSAIADDPAAAGNGEVLPSHWNAAHTVVNALDKTGDTMTGLLNLEDGAATTLAATDGYLVVLAMNPAAGATNTAPFELRHDAQTSFSGEQDPTLSFGYNVSGSVSTEPKFEWVIESNYSHGTNDLEWYLQLTRASSLGAANNIRPIMCTYDKALDVGNYSLQFTAASIVFDAPTTGAGANNMAMNLGGSGYYGSYIYAGRASGASRRLCLGTYQDPTRGANISLNDDSWSYGPSTTYRGALALQGGQPSGPVSGSCDGAVFVATGANGAGTFATERLRVEYGGNVCVGKPGVAASYLFDVAGDMGVSNATNGQGIGIKSLTELLTIAAAATSTTTIQKPAHSIILGVSVRVTTAVTCTTDFTVGDSTSAARFSTAAVSKAVNSTDKGTKAGAYYNATAEGIVITPDTVPSDATGRVRVTIHYLEVTAPTS